VNSKVPAILDSVLLSIDCIRGAPIWVGEAGKTMALKNERGKCMDELGQVIAYSGIKPG